LKTVIHNITVTQTRLLHVVKQDVWKERVNRQKTRPSTLFPEGQKGAIGPREAYENKGKKGKAIPVTGHGGP
jgi:hypothetical protein